LSGNQRVRKLPRPVGSPERRRLNRTPNWSAMSGRSGKSNRLLISTFFNYRCKRKIRQKDANRAGCTPVDTYNSLNWSTHSPPPPHILLSILKEILSPNSCAHTEYSVLQMVSPTREERFSRSDLTIKSCQ
jgi:hypothetical protein